MQLPPASEMAVKVLLVSAAAVVVAAPLRWFSVGAHEFRLDFSALDTGPLAVVSIGLVASLLAGAYGLRRTGNHLVFVAVFTVAMAASVAAVIVYVSSESIAGALPLPRRLSSGVPRPGPGLGLAMLGSLTATLASGYALVKVGAGATPDRRSTDHQRDRAAVAPLPPQRAEVDIDDGVPDF